MLHIPDTMKAYTIASYKSAMSLTSVPLPQMGPNDILVEVHAASLNPVDFKIRDGKLKMVQHFDMPLIMGNDFSGVVVAMGDTVHGYSVGDAVYGRPDKSRIGTFAQYLAIDQSDVAPMPKNLTFEEAASMPLVGLTTYQALKDILNLQPGQKILIHAGSGGVGTFAIQFAKQMGLHVATTVSDKGIDLVKKLGAHTIINYKTEDFSTQLNDYDAVFDTIGGSTLYNSFKVLKPHGHIVSVSSVPDYTFGKEHGYSRWKSLLFGIAAMKIKLRARAYHARYSFLFMKASGAQLREITQLIESNHIVPVIDRVYPFEQAVEALQYSESGRAKGKIIIQCR